MRTSKGGADEVARLATTHGSATWPDALRPVQRHDEGARELPIGWRPSTIAVASRQKQRCRRRHKGSLLATGAHLSSLAGQRRNRVRGAPVREVTRRIARIAPRIARIA